MKRTWIWVSLIVLVLAIAAGFVWYFMRPQASTVSCTNRQVGVYTQSDFAGDNACLPIAEYKAAALLLKGMADNTIKSIKVPSGLKAIVYKDDDFGTPSMVVTTDLADLNTVGLTAIRDWTTKISSIKVLATEPCAVSFYETKSYNGFGACLPVGEFKTLDLVDKYSINNDEIDSILVPSGFKATIYRDDDLKGDSLAVTTDLIDLNTIPSLGPFWDNKISSIKIETTPTSTVVSVYEGLNYTQYGAGLALGEYNQSALVNLGLNDNDISSIKIKSGFKAIIYANNDLSGFTETVRVDSPNLVNASFGNWNNKISYIKVMVDDGGSDCPNLTADLNIPKNCFVNMADYTIMYDQWTDNR